jgi:hypothetical protein
MRKLTIQRWAFRIGGVALIVVDLTAAAPTAAVTVGSVAVGGAVAGWGGM